MRWCLRLISYITSTSTSRDKSVRMERVRTSGHNKYKYTIKTFYRDVHCVQYKEIVRQCINIKPNAYTYVCNVYKKL